MLDVDVAGALAGGAKVAVYFSTFDEKGLVDTLSAVIDDQTNDPSVVSISWGWDENQPFNNGIPWSPAAIDHVNHSFLAVAHLGITVCVSTGDDGSEAQIQDGQAHVNFPATSPYVLAVGGTTLHARKAPTGRSRSPSRLERRPRQRHRRRRQRHHRGSDLAERQRAAVDQPRPLCRARDPRRRRQRRPEYRLSGHVGRQVRDRRRHQRLGAAVGEPGRPHQRAERRPRRQFQRAALQHDRPRAACCATSPAATTTPTGCSTVSSRPDQAGTPAPAGARRTGSSSWRRSNRLRAERIDTERTEPWAAMAPSRAR